MVIQFLSYDPVSFKTGPKQVFFLLQLVLLSSRFRLRDEESIRCLVFITFLSITIMVIMVIILTNMIAIIVTILIFITTVFIVIIITIVFLIVIIKIIIIIVNFNIRIGQANLFGCWFKSFLVVKVN